MYSMLPRFTLYRYDVLYSSIYMLYVHTSRCGHWTGIFFGPLLAIVDYHFTSPPPPHLDTVYMINTVKDEWGGAVGNLRHPSSLSLYTHPLSLKFALLPCHFGFLLSARKKLECPPGNS